MIVMNKLPKAFIVDDCKTMPKIIRNPLKQIDFNNVEEAIDGGEALAKLVAGLELLTEVRQDPRLHTLPFIMMIAESKIENVVAVKQAGSSNYISKPVNADSLKGKIEKVLCHA